MCFGSGASTPPVPEPAAPPPAPPNVSNVAIQAAGEGARRRAAAAAGFASTIATSPGGVTESASAMPKSLLGG